VLLVNYYVTELSLWYIYYLVFLDIYQLMLKLDPDSHFKYFRVLKFSAYCYC
jgi:hypothetical protein